jgi:hypothetical protein
LPFKPLQIFGAFFYYAVPRIAELHYFSTLIWISLGWMTLQHSRWLRWAASGLIVLTLITSFEPIQKNMRTVIFDVFLTQTDPKSYSLDQFQNPQTGLFPKRIIYLNGCAQSLYHSNRKRLQNEEIPYFSLCGEELKETEFCMKLKTQIDNHPELHHSFGYSQVLLEP